MYSLIQLVIIKSIFSFDENYFQGGDGNSICWDIMTNCIGAFVGFGLSILIYSHQIKKEKKQDKAEKEQKDKNRKRKAKKNQNRKDKNIGKES